MRPEKYESEIRILQSFDVSICANGYANQIINVKIGTIHRGVSSAVVSYTRELNDYLANVAIWLAKSRTASLDTRRSFDSLVGSIVKINYGNNVDNFDSETFIVDIQELIEQFKQTLP